MDHSKRQFIKGAAALAIAGTTGLRGAAFAKPQPHEDAMAQAALKIDSETANQSGAPFALPPLPYAENALEPHISGKTLSFHYGKHHQAYVTKLNELLEKEPELAKKSLEEIIQATAKDSAKATIFNNAAQVWNHTFFWHCMKPNGGGKPTGAIAAKIDEAFGSFDKFKEEFKNAGVTQFGSGWAWLVSEGGKLKITKTPNADLPLAHGQHAILTIDVWEHAYYLDYQNRRPDFLSTVLDNLINWDFANANLAKA